MNGFNGPTHLKYRKDIDGLRAVAVLSVVGFHAFPAWFKGGFIGVDVFFVISGFLISTIIFSDLEINNFSFLEFYGRRIRRIFPALILVLIACFTYGWFTLRFDEYKQLGKHIAGGAGFVANYVLSSESGYFDNAVETKPLLHLWSLGVEEQFYIVWPLLLWFSWRQRLNLLTITVLVGIVSFCLNIGAIGTSAVTAFYSPQTRFWELLSGAVLAHVNLSERKILPKLWPRLDRWLGPIVYAKAPEANGNTLRNVLSALGLGLLVIAALLISKERHFPGWWALLPIIGTVLIISAGMHAWVNRVVLSNRALTWFGLISFPLYLWHWPILSFARIAEGEVPTRIIRIAAVIVSVVLAWATYRFLEKPLRYGRLKKVKTVVLLVSVFIIGYIGLNSYQRNGLEFRSGPKLQVVHEGDIGHDIFFQYLRDAYYPCAPHNIYNQAMFYNGINRCFQSKKEASPTIAIVGDSHAEHLFIGLAQALPNANVVFYIKDSLPLIDNKDFRDIYNSILENRDLQTVILASFWTAKMEGMESYVPFKHSLTDTVRALTDASKKVYVVDDVPSFPFDPEKCKYGGSFSRKAKCSMTSEVFLLQQKIYLPLLRSIETTNPRAKVIEILKFFCDLELCTMENDGKLLYRDQSHLNINGSQYLGLKIVENYKF